MHLPHFILDFSLRSGRALSLDGERGESRKEDPRGDQEKNRAAILHSDHREDGDADDDRCYNRDQKGGDELSQRALRAVSRGDPARIGIQNR